MIFAFDIQSDRNFLCHCTGDVKDGGFGIVNRSFSTAKGDVGGIAVIGRLVNINNGTSEILDVIDLSTSFPKNTSDRAGGNREVDNVV